MILKHLILQNFRSYKKQEFSFDEQTVLIVGTNTSGKTNIIESIYLLSSGKSFRTDKDIQMIRLGQDVGRAKGLIVSKSNNEKTDLEVVISNGKLEQRETQAKKYLVNGVGKRRADFAANLVVVLFSPQDLEIIIETPSLRRRFLDEVLEQIDREYRFALTAYSKAIRQRNALLERTQLTGIRNEKQFEYWNNVLIENGDIITQKREKFINYVNNALREIFDFVMIYDKSIISKVRLEQYKEAELGAGVTLVGPHRDDFIVEMFNNETQGTNNIRFFGSRGQQRLAILQLKILELSYIEEKLGVRPVLLLDDIFSELDDEHINLILDMLGKQQTIITTTHKEFIPAKILSKMKLIELNVR